MFTKRKRRVTEKVNLDSYNMKNQYTIGEIIDHVKSECKKETEDTFIKGMIVGAVVASVSIILGFLF